MEERTVQLESATLGGGCFWCTEAVFKDLKGVHEVLPGYMGGHVDKPTYEQVCTGETGHAEVIRVVYDPGVISYGQLLGVFFATHDPTQLNRQGHDIGTQYRSVIFTRNADQAAAAAAFVSQLQADEVFDAPVVTVIEPEQEFFRAEDYHHDFYARNPDQGYCAAVITPKVSRFRREYADLLTGSA